MSRRRNKLSAAFRAATGSDYDPNRDYSAPLGTENNPIDASDVPVVKLTEEYNAQEELTHLYSPKKGPRMFRIIKCLAKPVLYTAIAALCLNLNTIKDSAVEWWNAPTALELGDWIKVQSCDNCNRVKLTGEGLMCPKCGEEDFSNHKAQKLQWNAIWGTAYNPRIEGYIFADGTVVTEPGHWIIPEREVQS